MGFVPLKKKKKLNFLSSLPLFSTISSLIHYCFKSFGHCALQEAILQTTVLCSVLAQLPRDLKTFPCHWVLGLYASTGHMKSIEWVSCLTLRVLSCHVHLCNLVGLPWGWLGFSSHSLSKMSGSRVFQGDRSHAFNAICNGPCYVSTWPGSGAQFCG